MDETTHEEERLEYTIRNCIKSYSNRSIYSWDFVDGYVGNPNDNGFASRNPLQALEMIEKLTPNSSSIFILKDFHLFLNDISVSRKMKNLAKILRNQPKTIIIVAPETVIPESIREIVTLVEFQLPQSSEIRLELMRLQESIGFKLPDSSIDSLILSCRGLSLERIRRVLSKVIATYKEINVESLEVIFKEKKQIIQQTQILEFCSTKDKLSDVGGLENLKDWLKRRSEALTKKAEKYGLPCPKGLMLVGAQGTGKSLTAKAIANDWNLPILRLDVGKLFGGIIGESESRMRQMINLSEAIAPCILWIDEIDKAFIGIESKGDSGTTGRVLATFITWLSEKQVPVFVVATANNIQLLPTEMLRKGRFDEIFFIGLPNEHERQSIFAVHLNKVRPDSYNNYDVDLLARKTKYFSGAEIEEVIIEAMHIAFSNNREFTMDDLESAIHQFIPLSISNGQDLDLLQDWASEGKIRLASREI
jgi:SpoVK/Ycf46/Vps4 family AAA+-type ATPase